MSTFGEDLLHFAATAHYVSQEQYLSTLDLIKKHLESTSLEVTFFAVVVHKVVSNQGKQQGRLVSEFPPDVWWDAEITEKGEYKGQTSLSYSIARPLWIVARDKQDLATAAEYQDLLGNAEPNRIPAYASIKNVSHSKTSIILPLKQGWQAFGAMNVESKLFVRASNTTLQELLRISKAISALRRSKEDTEISTKRTTEARERLIMGGFSSVLGNLQLFLASSGRAENDVMGEINDTLAKFEAHFDPFDWTQPGIGDIKENIWKNLSRSRFAICFISEPAKGGPHKYQDNPNVLIECGMLYALRESRQIQNFLIIREEDSPPTPFDINSEYMLIVPRHNGLLNRQKFRDRLEGHIRNLVKAIEPEAWAAQDI